MMKKLLSLFLAVLLLLTCNLSVAEEGNAVKAKLLSLWAEYLAIQDAMLHDDLVVCDALIALDTSRTWEQMLRTRAAVAAAMSNRSALGGLTLSEPLTTSEKIELITLGVDVDPFVMDMEGLNDYLGIELSTLLEFNLTLIGDSFDIKSLSWSRDWAVLKKATVEDNAIYLCLMTNHLLNTLGYTEQAVSFWAQMDEKYPTIAKYKDAFTSNDDALYNTVDAHLTKMEDDQVKHSAHAGKGEHMLNTMKYAMETGSDYFTKKNMIVYEGAPVKLPLAPWWGELGKDIFAYYTLDAESNMIRITMDSDLSVTPDVEVVQTSGVAKQDVLDYAAYLMDIGLQASSLSGNEANEEPFSVTLRKGSIMLIVRWNNGSASVWNVGNRVMFVPDWYVILANQK